MTLRLQYSFEISLFSKVWQLTILIHPDVHLGRIISFIGPMKGGLSVWRRLEILCNVQRRLAILLLCNIALLCSVGCRTYPLHGPYLSVTALWQSAGCIKRLSPAFNWNGVKWQVSIHTNYSICLFANREKVIQIFPEEVLVKWEDSFTFLLCFQTRVHRYILGDK